HEIKALGDTATILRGGRVVDTCDPRKETSRAMAEKRIGASLKEGSKDARTSFGADKLVVRDLSTEAEDEFGVAISDVSFTVHEGEILGIAGVAGNGQNALLAALSGEVLGGTDGAITLDGHAIGVTNTTGRRRLGLCAVPEERNG